MLKKFFYFGLGLADLLYEYFDELVRAGEERANTLLGPDQPIEDSFEIETVISVDPISEGVDLSADVVVADDLTTISGIGPTFAKKVTGSWNHHLSSPGGFNWRSDQRDHPSYRMTSGSG